MENIGFDWKPRVFLTRTEPILNPYFTRTNPLFFYGLQLPLECLVFRAFCSKIRIALWCCSRTSHCDSLSRSRCSTKGVWSQISGYTVCFTLLVCFDSQKHTYRHTWKIMVSRTDIMMQLSFWCRVGPRSFEFWYRWRFHSDIALKMKTSTSSLGLSCQTLRDGVDFLAASEEEQRLMKELQDLKLHVISSDPTDTWFLTTRKKCINCACEDLEQIIEGEEVASQTPQEALPVRALDHSTVETLL